MKYSFVLLILFCFACGTDDDLSVETIKGIDSMMKNYRQAWMSGDSAEILKHISNDVILYMPSEKGTPIHGKEAVRDFWFPPSDISYPIYEYEISNQKIEGNNSIAIMQGISKLSWYTLDNNTPIDSSSVVSEFMSIIRNENGQWKIHRQMYNIKDSGYKG